MFHGAWGHRAARHPHRDHGAAGEARHKKFTASDAGFVEANESSPLASGTSRQRRKPAARLPPGGTSAPWTGWCFQEKNIPEAHADHLAIARTTIPCACRRFARIFPTTIQDSTRRFSPQRKKHTSERCQIAAAQVEVRQPFEAQGAIWIAVAWAVALGQASLSGPAVVMAQLSATSAMPAAKSRESNATSAPTPTADSRAPSAHLRDRSRSL
ncbi:unnamed protein product [Prorocentrum cordatum]|uniref:Uncharacterized protein n=1 Tax=Prorocentrum cordatum TaxID=2364126 RepID=A0ABN9TNA0_9DINO|nr:unnamed protein product [Polarella glacialis]